MRYPGNRNANTDNKTRGLNIHSSHGQKNWRITTEKGYDRFCVIQRVSTPGSVLAEGRRPILSRSLAFRASLREGLGFNGFSPQTPTRRHSR